MALSTTTSLPQPSRRWTTIGLTLAAVLAVIGLSNKSSNAQPTPSVLEVDEVVYEFEPATCRVTDQDFIVTGPGAVGEDTFVVTASSKAIELAFGVGSEIETPAPQAIWLSSAEDITWQNIDGTIIADVELHNRNSPDAPVAEAHLEFTCPSA